MENQNAKIDDIFRQRLLDAEVPPPPFVWPAVEQALQKRKRRVLVLALLAFGMLTAGGAWLWQSGLWNPAHAYPDQANLPIASPLKSLPESSASGSNASYTNHSSLEAIKVQASKDESLSKKDLQAPIVVSKMEQSNRNMGSARFTPDGSTIQAETKPGVESVQNQQNALQATELLQANSKTLEPWVILAAEEPLRLADLRSVLSLSAQNRPVLPPKNQRFYAHRKKTPPKLCYDFGQHPRAWLFDLYAGPSLAQRSLNSRLENEPYLNQRLATESRNVSINAGLRASLMFNRNFLIRSGLQFDQITEEFEYIDPTYIKISINDIYVNGQFVGSDTIVEYGENYLKTYNRYTMLDIPLMVGVEMRQGRSGFSINAGITTNVLFQKKGVIIDPQTHEPARIGSVPEDLKAIGPRTSLSEDVFRTNLGLSATASIQWYWHLRPHFRLFVEPAFRQILRPVTVNRHPVEQRYSVLGLRLGATKIF